MAQPTCSTLKGSAQEAYWNTNQTLRRPAEWSVAHAPAANAAATITKAAGGAGVRHTATSLTASLAVTGLTSTAVNVVLRDGAAGVGTVLWQAVLAVPAVVGSADRVVLAGVSIEGSADTPMTLEFTAAGGANALETVALTGCSV